MTKINNKLGNAPVYYAVVQVRFNPILNLENYLPNIQDVMRKRKFSDFNTRITQTVEFMDSSGGPTATKLQTSQFQFGDLKGCSSYVLKADRLSFQTVDYDTYDDFSNHILVGLNALNEILEFEFVERIGIRYLDAVIPMNHDEPLSKYLNPRVLGLSLDFEGQGLQYSMNETLKKEDSDFQVLSRVVIRDGKVGLPRELGSSALKPLSRFTGHEGMHAIIDSDGSRTRRVVFNIDDIGDTMEKLYTDTKDCFEKTITDFAVEAWK